MDTFLLELFEVMITYYHALIKILPRIGLAILILFLTFIVAIQVRKVLRTRLLRHTDDSLFTGFIAQLTCSRLKDLSKLATWSKPRGFMDGSSG